MPASTSAATTAGVSSPARSASSAAAATRGDSARTVASKSSVATLRSVEPDRVGPGATAGRVDDGHAAVAAKELGQRQVGRLDTLGGDHVLVACATTGDRDQARARAPDPDAVAL